MTEREFLVLYAIEAVCGAAGGIAWGRWKWGPGPGRWVSGVSGSIGGLIVAWVAGFVPWLASFVGHVEAAADATMRATGGLTPTVLVGAGIAGLLGGAILTAVVGLVLRRGANRL